MMFSSRAVKSLVVAAAAIGCFVLQEVGAENGYCCLASKDREDPCNPDKYECWPLERILGYADCGRRDHTDCFYDEPGTTRDACCGDASDCYEEPAPPGEYDSCYGGWGERFVNAENTDSDVYQYCTMPGFFYLDGQIPANGFDGTVCGAEGFGGLDPHFETWNGTWYDYMGVCDLVFLHAPDFDNGRGLEIQVRTKERSDKAQPFKYTYIESAAIQIGGTDVLEVHSYGDYTFNGESNAQLPAKMGGFPITRRVIDEERSNYKFTVTINKMERVIISVFKEMVSITIKKASYKSFGTSRGLMGQFGSGVLLARNSSSMPHGTEVEFAEDWQVRDTDAQLFTFAREPQYPQKCILGPGSDAAADAATFRRHLRQSSVTEEAAKAACAHVKNQKGCINDVVLMDDLDLAGEFPHED